MIFGEQVPSGTETTSTADPASQPPANTDPGVAVTGETQDPPAGAASGQPEGTPAPQYLDVDNLGSHLVKVQVAGQETELPLSEALQGVMRQQDYTRKTQEVAEARRQLGQADALVAQLDADPVRTIKMLAGAYDLDLENGLQAPEPDPVAERLAPLEQELQGLRQQAVRQQIDAEVRQLKEQYGEFDVNAVAEAAVRMGTDLTTAYKAVNFDTMRTQQSQQAKQEQARQAALAAQVVEGGHSTQRGAVGAKPAPVNSVRDAWNNAKKAHGL